MESARNVVDADGLGVRTRRGWVYSDVSLRCGSGAVVAVAGPGRSGRTALLLTVAGRMRPTAGALSVLGLPLPGAAPDVRRRVAVARATGAAEPEPGLRVREHVRERLLTLPAGRAWPFDAACELAGLDVPGAALAEDLTPADATRLALALALMERPALLVLDDLDDGADGPSQYALWEAARRAADAGVTVLAATTDPGPAAGLADAFVPLEGR